MIKPANKKNMAADPLQKDSFQKTTSGETTILFVVCIAQFLMPFMMSSVGVALPAISREFSASAVQLGLVETVYILGACLFLLPAGRMGDIHGRKKVFITGFIVFTAATVLVGTAGSIRMFILFRFLQGSGAALVTGAGIAIITSVFHPSKRGRVMGIVVACVYCGLSLGPTMAGVMVTHWGWRWIFHVTVLIQVIALVLILLKLKGEWADARGETFDWAGSMIYMISLSALIYGASMLETSGTGKYLMVAGLLGIIAFLVVEYHTKFPVLDVNLILSNRIFAFSNIATLINYAASFGVTFFFSLYLQFVKGLSPQHTGLILISQPMIQAILSPVAGRLADKYAPARIATAGMIITAAGLGVAATVGQGTGIATVVIMLILLGTGFAFFSSPNMTTVMGSVEPRHYGIAASFISTMRTVGMLASMTIITIIFSMKMGDQAVSEATKEVFLLCMHLSMVLFCLFSIIGISFSMCRLKPPAPLPEKAVQTNK